MVAGVGGSVTQGEADVLVVVVVLPSHSQVGEEGLCTGGLFATVEFGGGVDDGGQRKEEEEACSEGPPR